MRPLLWLVLSATAFGQGIDTRLAPADYPAHAQAGDCTIAAQYHYRSFRAGNQSYYVKRYIVVETAVFGPKSRRMQVSSGQFTLRINGKKSIVSQAPGMIAYQDRTGISDPSAVILVPGGGVVLGGPQGPQFPGDRRAPPERDSPVPVGAERPETAEKPSQNELMRQTAFPYGERRLPVAGYIYFPYSKKLTSIKKLELLYKGPAGETTLQLK